MVTVDDPVGFNDPDGRDPTYYATGVAYGPTGLPESIDPAIAQLFGLSGGLMGSGMNSSTGVMLIAISGFSPGDTQNGNLTLSLRMRLGVTIAGLTGTNCENVLSSAGISLDQLEKTALSAQYYLGPSSSATMNDIAPGFGGGSSISDFAARYAVRQAIALTVTVPVATAGMDISALNIVVLTSLWQNQPDAYQDFTLLHEELHYVMQASDQAILSYFHIGPAPDGSDPFTHWLSTDCGNSSPAPTTYPRVVSRLQ